MLLLLRAVGAGLSPVLLLLAGALPLVLLTAWPVLLVALLRRRWPLAVAAAAVAAGHLLVLVPPLTAASPPPPGTALRVVTANLYVLNDTPVAAGRALRALEPDVLVVPELDGRGLAGLRAAGLLIDLPHAVIPLAGRQETVGLLSRHRLRDVELARVGGRVQPRATVDVAGTPVRVLAAHPLPPALTPLVPLWREVLEQTAAEVRGLDLAGVVAGDLNADRDHAAFRELLDAGLRDAHDERGEGLARTWPAALPLLHLDHVLVTEELGVAAVDEVRLPGSDHLAVVADLVVPVRRARSSP